MKITILSLVMILFNGPVFAQKSGVIEPGNTGYVHIQKSSKWTLDVNTESSSNIEDPPLGSRVKITQRTGTKVVKNFSFVIDKYYNSTGVAYIEMDHLDSPLFLVQLFSSADPQSHEQVFLISPDCKKKPLFKPLSVLGESINQIEIRPSATDVSITYTPHSGGSKITKTWTAKQIKNELSSSSCR